MFCDFTLCAATFSNSYVKWGLCYVMLRFVAVPLLPATWARFTVFLKKQGDGGGGLFKEGI